LDDKTVSGTPGCAQEVMHKILGFAHLLARPHYKFQWYAIVKQISHLCGGTAIPKMAASPA
jgi:hypothetical protein